MFLRHVRYRPHPQTPRKAKFCDDRTRAGSGDAREHPPSVFLATIFRAAGGGFFHRPLCLPLLHFSWLRRLSNIFRYSLLYLLILIHPRCPCNPSFSTAPSPPSPRRRRVDLPDKDREKADCDGRGNHHQRKSRHSDFCSWGKDAPELVESIPVW